WLGRAGQGEQVWSTYWLSPRNKIQFNYRHQKAVANFVPGGGTVNDFGVKAEIWIGARTMLTSSMQYERWNFPILADGPQANVASSVGITFFPRTWKRSRIWGRRRKQRRTNYENGNSQNKCETNGARTGCGGGFVRGRAGRSVYAGKIVFEVAAAVAATAVSNPLHRGGAGCRDADRFFDSEAVRIHGAIDAAGFSIDKQPGHAGRAIGFGRAGNAGGGSPRHQEHRRAVRRRVAEQNGRGPHCGPFRPEEGLWDEPADASAAEIGGAHGGHRGPEERDHHHHRDGPRSSARRGDGQCVRRGTQYPDFTTQHFVGAARAHLPGKPADRREAGSRVRGTGFQPLCEQQGGHRHYGARQGDGRGGGFAGRAAHRRAVGTRGTEADLFRQQRAGAFHAGAHQRTAAAIAKARRQGGGRGGGWN